MPHIAQDSLANIYFELIWKSSHAQHVDGFYAENVSFIRDILPLGLKSKMRGLAQGDSVEIVLDPSDIPLHEAGKVLDLPVSRFKPAASDGRAARPRIGRFYPKRLIEDTPGTRPDSTAPFRIVSTDKAGFKADMNHPLAGREVLIKATVMEVKQPETDSGTMRNWNKDIMRGPGIQVRLEETPTDFLGANPFVREDESDDGDFYSETDPVVTFNPQADTNIRAIYGELLENGTDILDLMAGVNSHLPKGLAPNSLTGLGLSQKDMETNTALDHRVIHNLNEAPILPFDDAQFDAVISTATVEYMTKPFEVFEDVARILKSGGIFALTFLDHWFEPKCVDIWSELHEFERMGLVSQYFIRAEVFDQLNTRSERGWPNKGGSSDSVFAVWGTKK